MKRKERKENKARANFPRIQKITTFHLIFRFSFVYSISSSISPEMTAVKEHKWAQFITFLSFFDSNFTIKPSKILQGIKFAIRSTFHSFYCDNKNGLAIEIKKHSHHIHITPPHSHTSFPRTIREPAQSTVSSDGNYDYYPSSMTMILSQELKRTKEKLREFRRES